MTTATARQEKIRSEHRARLAGVPTAAESEILDQIVALADGLSPIQRQKLAMHLMAMNEEILAQ